MHLEKFIILNACCICSIGRACPVDTRQSMHLFRTTILVGRRQLDRENIEPISRPVLQDCYGSGAVHFNAFIVAQLSLFQIMTFIYTDRVNIPKDGDVTDVKLLRELVSAADYFQLFHLKQQYERPLVEHLLAVNAC